MLSHLSSATACGNVAAAPAVAQTIQPSGGMFTSFTALAAWTGRLFQLRDRVFLAVLDEFERDLLALPHLAEHCLVFDPTSHQLI